MADIMSVEQAWELLDSVPDVAATLRLDTGKMEAMRATLRAEIERLEKDAGRYEWIVTRMTRMEVESVASRCPYPEHHDIDAFIDAAKGASEGGVP